VITGIDGRIAEYKTPKSSNQGIKEEEIPSLPRLASPIRDGSDMFNTPSKSKTTAGQFMQGVGDLAKNVGQSPPGRNSPNVRKLLDKAESTVLTPKQKEAGLSALFKENAISFLKTDLGRPFRQEFRRRIASIVLGSPYGDVGIIVDAIDALTRLAVTSLVEDKYGNVQRDVKMIIQTLTKTVTELETFTNSLGCHWTDVEGKQESPEVDTILATLRGGLNELIDSFGDYSEDLRLSQNDMRMAREAATPAKPQMQQIGR
jgi:nucleoporin NDC1